MTWGEVGVGDCMHPNLCAKRGQKKKSLSQIALPRNPTDHFQTSHLRVKTHSFPRVKCERYTVVELQATLHTYVPVIKQTNGLKEISICHTTQLAGLNISF